MRCDEIKNRKPKKYPPLYFRWRNMKARCERPNDRNYRNYGGRGIKVCERWQKFKNFLADMGMPPDSSFELDRIDNCGDYEPGNCKWVTRKENALNKRSNRLVTLEGVSRPIVDWAREFNINASTVYSRLFRGLSIEQALELQPHESIRHRKKFLAGESNAGA